MSSPMCFQRTRSNTLLQMHSPLDWVRVHATDACALVWHVRVTCMHRERTRANQVAQAKAFASRMVDEGRLHASPNRAEFRQDSVMWVSARCTRTYPQRLRARASPFCRRVCAPQAWTQSMPTYAPSSMRRPPEADKGAEEAVKLEEEAAVEKCVGLLRGL